MVTGSVASFLTTLVRNLMTGAPRTQTSSLRCKGAFRTNSAQIFRGVIHHALLEQVGI